MLLTSLCLSAAIMVSPNDSLIILLNEARRTSNPHLESRLFNTIAFDWLSHDRYDSALPYFQGSLRLNQKLKNDTLAAQNFNDIGLVFYQLGALDSSLWYYEQALAAFEKEKLLGKEAITRLNLSMVYYDKGAYEKALEFALESVPGLERTSSLQALGSCFNILALIYSRLKEFDTAIEFHNRALVTRKKIDNRRGVAQSFNNIANIYKELKAYDSALTYYDRSLKLKSDLNDIAGSASTLNNMGEVMLALHRLVEAEGYFLESLRIKKESGNRAGEVYTQNNLARLALMRKRYPQAKRHLDFAEEGAAALGLLDEIRVNYSLRVRYLKETDNPALALRYSEQLMKIKDSLLTMEKAEALAEIQTAYEIEKKDQQITLLEQERALQQSALALTDAWVKGLSLASTLALAIVGLIYWQYHREQQNRKGTQTLLKELHHRVKNNLQILSSVLSLQAQQLTDEQALQAVKSSESRVNAMALIHRKLYSKGQDRTINIKSYITELITYLVHSYGFSENGIKVNLSLQDVEVDIDKAIPLGLIINELISNAFKHAYIDHPSPALTIDLFREKEGLKIDIGDNGNAIRGGKGTRSGSFGLRLVNMLMGEMKGRYEMSLNEGTRYQLTIPL